MPTDEYPLPGSGDHPRPASFGTEQPRQIAGPPLTAWIDEPTQVRLILSADSMPVLEFIGSGKRIEIGLDGPDARRQLRAALDRLEQHIHLIADLTAAAGMDAA